MYNNALTEFLTFVFTFSLALTFIVGLIYGIISDKVEPLRFSDKFDIGYIRDEEPEHQIQAVVTTTVEKPKPPVNPILQDCADFLMVMGVPSRKARAEAEILLQNKNIKTVQDFIKEYTKK